MASAQNYLIEMVVFALQSNSDFIILFADDDRSMPNMDINAPIILAGG